MISKISANVQRPMPASKHLSLALLFTLALCCGASGQTTLYVDDDNCPSPGSGSVIDPYCSIQDAIVASVDGDTVEVAPGTYFEAIDFIGKAITLRSRDGAATTIIDATNVPAAGETVSVVRCVNGETVATVLDGFTITGGTGDTNVSSFPIGGGMYNDGSSPLVVNSIFYGNSAMNGLGGGMANNASSPTVTHCMFHGNNSEAGGGMVNIASNPTVSSCMFIRNTALDGGGMLNIGISNGSSNPRVTNCMFYYNTAMQGGGMVSNGNPIVTNCTFNNNMANFGGGMLINSGNPRLSNCTFNGNVATGRGGGMYNIFVGSPLFTGCILWGNSPDEIYNLDVRTLPTIAHCNVSGSGGSASWDTSLGTDGGGNIDVDPLFVDPLGPDGIAGTADDDLRLMPGSPCIDAGDYDAYLAAGGGLVDLDGKDRVIDNTGVMDTGVGSVTYLDMGAYEQGPCHRDGIINLNDLESLVGCLVGPASEVNIGCVCSDYNMDANVDLLDYASYQLEFTGPPTPTAMYQLTFESTWSAATHPQDFPSGAHFSGLIGGTHNRNAYFWEVGSLSSVGIENMAEVGSKTALTNEVNAAISAGDAGSVISGGVIGPSPGSVSVNFTATQAFGLVTITSMIAPSPDWFVGLDSVVLFNHNQWADEIVISIEPYDAGTDDGVTFTSANADTNPAEVITQIVGFPFLNGATQAPLGTFTITRID
ncbi:spondin domain-containing protein [bacterium AH-315-J04]|nr:spondin domain-containing protein [bacterium AH-315-J04]